MARQFCAVLLVVLAVTGCQLKPRLTSAEARRIAEAFVREPGLPVGLHVGRQWNAHPPTTENAADDKATIFFDVASASLSPQSIPWGGLVGVDVRSRRVSDFSVRVLGKMPVWRSVPVPSFSTVGRGFAERLAPEVFNGPGQLVSSCNRGIPPDVPNGCGFWRVDHGWKVPVWVDVSIAMDGVTVCRYDLMNRPYRVPEKVISEAQAIAAAQRVYQQHSGHLGTPSVPVSRIITVHGRARYLVKFGGDDTTTAGGLVAVPVFGVPVDAVTGKALRKP